MSDSHVPSPLALAAAAAALVACNAVTGASGLTLGGASSSASTNGTSPGGGTTTTTSSAGGAGGAGAAGGGTTTTTTSGAGGGGPCSPACGAHAHCEVPTSSCVCDFGYVAQGGACAPAAPGDPAAHTKDDVCAAWKAGHVVTEPSPLVASGQQCDAGSLTKGALHDTLQRLDMFRWLSGLGPVDDDASYDADAQKCANMEAFWDFGQGGSPHQPPPSVPCYTPEGGATAGQSNIAWGSGSPAQAIDQFVEDSGNEGTMGHRRWIMNPPLGPVGIGYWQTGGQYGNAECLRVFASNGQGPSPAWVAVPNPGFAPVTVAGWTWTFHGSLGGIANATITVLDVDANAPLAVNVKTLAQGYAQDAISWTPSGWTPTAGKTYRVTIGGLSGGDVTYDVKPIDCN
jgi:hypothetical protein